MTSERPYQKIKTKQEAREELIRCKGTQFDPDLVDKFLEIIDKI
jgi:response regulator RpfG family c-di-GMP phosphodiesterase